MLSIRYQVLLDDWLADYIKFLTEKFDLSTSSVIRTNICVAILYTTQLLYPEFKHTISEKELRELATKEAKDELEEAELHRILSKVIFEARKAVEFRLAKEKETKEIIYYILPSSLKEKIVFYSS